MPPRRGFLVAAAEYSLTNIQPDFIVPSLGQGGLRLVAPDSAHTVTDAASSTPDFAEGTPLPAFTSPPFVHHAWNRLKVAGRPQDTANNAADFRLVSTVRGPINGVPSALGSPSPQNSLGTYQQNAAMQSTLLDPNVSRSVAPNRVRTPAPWCSGERSPTDRAPRSPRPESASPASASKTGHRWAAAPRRRCTQTYG
ncbi:hypothetical protein GCM10027614_71290 [Micromonospora vulcania]